jgi:hypothetical protein
MSDSWDEFAECAISESLPRPMRLKDYGHIIKNANTTYKKQPFQGLTCVYIVFCVCIIHRSVISGSLCNGVMARSQVVDGETDFRCGG